MFNTESVTLQAFISLKLWPQQLEAVRKLAIYCSCSASVLRQFIFPLLFLSACSVKII